jgi:hypothetical protein
MKKTIRPAMLLVLLLGVFVLHQAWSAPAIVLAFQSDPQPIIIATDESPTRAIDSPVIAPEPTQPADYTADTSHLQPGSLTELLFSVPLGPDGVSYEIAGLQDTEAWGPTAIAVGPDNIVWVADTAAKRLLAYTTAGSLINTISLEGTAEGVEDLLVSTQGIWILDRAVQPASLVLLDSSGTVLERKDITAEDSEASIGLTLSREGNVELQMSGSIQLEVDKPSPAQQPALGSTSVILEETERIDTLSVLADGLRLHLPRFGDTGAIRLLGRGSDGSVYLIREDVFLTDVIHVDQTVRHYAADGTLLGVARFPVDDQFVYVARNLALSNDGNVLALIARPNGIEVHRLIFYPELPSIADDTPPSVSNEVAGSRESTCTISRNTIISNAAAYFNNSITLSNTNVNGACAGRTKPRYLGGAGTYSSVPYDWGGRVSLSQFRTDMNNGKQAGDINTAGVESCSSGVDCSGFISRVWQLSGDSWTTANLPNAGIRLSSTASLRPGDILNHASSHVALFHSSDSSSVVVYESTTYGSMDQVIFFRHSWTRYNGYIPYRYNNLCEGDSDDERTIGNGQSLTGTINPNNDTDTYYFNASAGQKATIRMNKSGSSLDSYLILYAPNGSEVTRDDDAGGDRNSLINNVNLSQSGRYRIAASSYGASSGGAYTLSLQLTSQSPQCNPSADQVALFIDSEYRGQCVVRNVGAYSNPSSIGMPNDSISSVKVGSNVLLKLYEHDNYGGRGSTFTSNYSNLSGTNVGNDSASSMKVERRGTANLALNRPASASSQENSSTPASKANDGSTGTRWSSRHASSNTNEWWKVDLGSRQTINKVVVRWETAYAARHYIGWSDNGTDFSGFWVTISAPGTWTYTFAPVTARYVIVYSTQHAPCCGNYSFWEVEVYRTPQANLLRDDTLLPGIDNVGQTVTLGSDDEVELLRIPVNE